MMERVKENFGTYCGLSFLVMIVLKIIGMNGSFLEYIVAGFGLGGVLWIPVKVHMNAVDKAEFVYISSYDNSKHIDGENNGIKAFVGLILLYILLSTWLGNGAAAFIMAGILAISLFVL